MTQDTRLQKNIWKNVHYINRPSSESEIEIFNFLEKEIVALIYKNFKYLDTIILNDAVFVNSYGEINNKTEYLDWLNKWLVIKKCEYSNTFIKIKSETFVSVFYQRRVVFQNYTELVANMCYELVKSNLGWKIAKSSPSPYCSIKYLKIPMSSIELEVSKILEELVTAEAYKDYKYLDYLILNDAIFIGKAGKIRNKSEFIEDHRKKTIRSLEYLNTFIEIKNSDTANVFYLRHIISHNGKEVFISKRKEMIKFNSSWKIIRECSC